MLIGDAVHPMTRKFSPCQSTYFDSYFEKKKNSAGRGMGANQALRDASAVLPFLLTLAEESQRVSPEELSALTDQLARAFEHEMFPRAFNWVNGSNRSAEMDVTTKEGKFVIWCLCAVMSFMDFFVKIAEWVGCRRAKVARM